MDISLVINGSFRDLGFVNLDYGHTFRLVYGHNFILGQVWLRYKVRLR